MLGFVRSPAVLLSALVLAGICLCEQSGDPWPKPDLLPAATLAQEIQSAKPPAIVCVAFPVLYRNKRILHAVGAGPGSSPEGIEALKRAVAALPKDSNLVIYCGCCPMERCPNIRPAYRALKEA